MTKEEYILNLRQMYCKGDVVRLLASSDKEMMKKHFNDYMIIDYVDDEGQIHGQWIIGRGSLAINLEEDVIVKEKLKTAATR